MRRRLSHLTLGLYPLAFRRRYGEELAALIDDSAPRTMASVDLLRGALSAHVRPPASLAGVVDPPDVVRASASGILACWVLFAAAGFGFYKTTEDHAFTSAQHAHPLLGGAHLGVQVIAVLASLVILAAALPLGIAAIRAARGDPDLRRLVVAPLIALGVLSGLTALLVLAAHRGHHSAGTLGHAAFIGWGLAAACCAVICVAAARRLLFAIPVQRAGLVGALALGTLATAGMIAMALATAAYAIALPQASAVLAAQPNGPLQLLDVGYSLALQSLVMCAAATLAVVTARRGWRAARS